MINAEGGKHFLKGPGSKYFRLYCPKGKIKVYYYIGTHNRLQCNQLKLKNHSKLLGQKKRLTDWIWPSGPGLPIPALRRLR